MSRLKLGCTVTSTLALPTAPSLALCFLVGPAAGQQLLDQKDGTMVNERLGWIVSGGRDVDGDGVPDYLVTHSIFSATVYSGADGSVLHSLPGQFRRGALVGDLNADGHADFASSYQTYSGADASELFPTNTICSSVNDWVDGLGDIDGDGRDDVIVGSLFNFFDDDGGHVLFSGQTGTKIREICGNIGVSEPGSVVRGLGDVNGDGVGDYAYSDFARRQVLIQSGPTGFNLNDLSGPILFGYSLAGPGDVDQDGFADYLIGSPEAAPAGASSGQALLYSGQDHSILDFFDGTEAEQGMGGTVSEAGDVNGDGWPDFLIAKLPLINLIPGPGKGVGLYSGKSRRLLYEFIPARLDDRFGASLSAAGDVNGDGLDDILIGAWSARPGGVSDAGSVYLYGGSQLYLNLTPRSIQAGDSFTRSLGEGTPGNLTLIAIIDVNGTPVLVSDGFGLFDSTGFDTRTSVLPPGFSGFTLTFRGWAIGPGGNLLSTTPEVVTLP